MCRELTNNCQFHEAAFEAFLCSLGLHRVEGTPKAGWQTFAHQVSSAGFP